MSLTDIFLAYSFDVMNRDKKQRDSSTRQKNMLYLGIWEFGDFRNCIFFIPTVSCLDMLPQSSNTGQNLLSNSNGSLNENCSDLKYCKVGVLGGSKKLA